MPRRHPHAEDAPRVRRREDLGDGAQWRVRRDAREAHDDQESAKHERTEKQTKETSDD
jgi:hypothetical protein